MTAPRVGLFGLLGTGNIGNDASMEAVLRYLKAEHSDAILDAMCRGPEYVRVHYGIEAIPLLWYQKYEQRAAGVTLIALKVLTKAVDAFRTASWVRRHDVVIVPGMGVLEATLPLRPWQTPYAMLLLCASVLTPVLSAGLTPGCGILQSPLWNRGISARLRSAVGYIGPCGDILGQLALTLEDCTGVTSVAGG